MRSIILIGEVELWGLGRESFINILTMSKEESESQNTTVEFLILAGSFSDLSVLDFSIVNIQCLKIDSEELKKICQETTYKALGEERNWELLKRTKEEFWDKETNLYVLLPIDFSKEVKESDLYYTWHLIRLIYPSDLDLLSEIKFQLVEDRFIHWITQSMYNFRPSGIESRYENYLFFQEDNTAEITRVNEFIGLFFERIHNLKFIKIALNSYSSSFSEASPTMAYLSLCISLESIVAGNTELSYRIKRNVGLLCGDSSFTAEIIFNNLGKIYDLRSKIVHAGDYNYNKVNEYLPYLRTIVSRMIIEVVLINITDLVELNNKLTFAGFYESSKISENYKELKFNILSSMDSIYTKLEK